MLWRRRNNKCVGVARTSLRDAARTTKLLRLRLVQVSDHRRHRHDCNNLALSGLEPTFYRSRSRSQYQS
ncbi:hypothetical protein [Nostoc sp.]|uniref:hypothetical protein n=1 Tax=Nostoc sp. TaxID=1180 RepID=UPI002FFC2765